MKDHVEGEEAKAPTIIKALPVVKWSEVLTDFLHSVVGIRMITLAYESRESAMPARKNP